MTTVLEPGNIAPPFSLPDANGRIVSLSDFGPGRVIVYFYPAALTPGCTRQAVDFEGHLDDLKKAGLRVVGISPDPVDRIAEFGRAEQIDFPLLSDTSRETLIAYGAYGEKKLYGKVVTGVLRSTFVVSVDADGQGTIELAQYNVRATGHVERLLNELGVPVAG